MPVRAERGLLVPLPAIKSRRAANVWRAVRAIGDLAFIGCAGGLAECGMGGGHRGAPLSFSPSY